MISVAIPTYYNSPKIIEVLEVSFNKFLIQVYKDFEIVISDHSEGNEIEVLCEKWSDKLPIKYFKNEIGRGFLTANYNNAIIHCSGEIIKFLDQDDYLFNEFALENINAGFEEEDMWLATAYYHTHDRENLIRYHAPTMNDRIYIVNTVGTPSCVAIRNKDILFFDEKLKWAGDCEYYKRLFDKFGEPKLMNDVTVVQYLWDNQTTHIYNEDMKLQEFETKYIVDKYEN